MIIYGLSGKSGTGKSYNAIEICARRGIPALIDDGLFIYENSVVAGISAKKQETKVGAIKTALFFDEEHAKSVKEAIGRVEPEAILVLGTSDKMVDQICQTLGLGEISEYIHIEDVTTQQQREAAKNARRGAGMHTIPAPTFELKKQFSGYFLNAKRSFKFTNRGKLGTTTDEKTIVRPTYSYLGSYEISDKVISDIAEMIIDKTEGCSQMLWTTSSNTDEGMFIRVILMCEWGAKLKTTARVLRQRVYDTVSSMTAFNVIGVEVEIRGFRAKSNVTS